MTPASNAPAGSHPQCIFCRIVAGTAPAKIFYQDERVTAFQDTQPSAPVHILLVPNLHLDSINDARPEDEALLGHLLWVASQLAQQQGISQSGYRLTINTGAEGGQSVLHMHLHLAGGQKLGHPFR